MSDLHESITRERVIEAVERWSEGTDNPGFCRACGKEADGVAPDETDVECEYCGEDKVTGAAELLMEV
jgi:hypothetical protein